MEVFHLGLILFNYKIACRLLQSGDAEDGCAGAGLITCGCQPAPLRAALAVLRHLLRVPQAEFCPLLALNLQQGSVQGKSGLARFGWGQPGCISAALPHTPRALRLLHLPQGTKPWYRSVLSHCVTEAVAAQPLSPLGRNKDRRKAWEKACVDSERRVPEVDGLIRSCLGSCGVPAAVGRSRGRWVLLLGLVSPDALQESSAPRRCTETAENEEEAQSPFLEGK